LLHGWPELSLSWRHQLPCFASLGFRAVAPDLRGYGRSSVYLDYASYALEHIVHDMLEMLDALGQDKAVWIGHDWGSPVVWSLASHHPERCSAVANLCVPYLAEGFTPATLVPLVDRRVYPEAQYPVGQWDYQLFYLESFDKAWQAFEANVRNTVKALFRKGSPKAVGAPSRTAGVRKAGGWFGAAGQAPDVPLDTDVLTEDELAVYTAALQRNGFFGPDSYYMNPDRNAAGLVRYLVLFVMKLKIRTVEIASDAGPPAPQPEQVAIDVARSWSIAFDDETHHVEVRWRSRLRRVATRAADGGNRLARRHDIAQFDVQAAQVRVVEKAAADGVVDVHVSSAAQDAAGRPVGR